LTGGMFRDCEFCLFELEPLVWLVVEPPLIKPLISPHIIVNGNIRIPKKSPAYVTKLFEEEELLLLADEVGIKLLITLDALDRI